jgi:hypothetical protein
MKSTDNKKNGTHLIEATATSKPAIAAQDFSQSQCTLITCRSEGEKGMLSLFEARSGDYFVVKRDEDGEHVIPVTPATAGMILAGETRRHMGKIFNRKLQSSAIVSIQGRAFDTTRDELIWMEYDDDVEAAAAYRTSSGVEYLRLINPWRDMIILFRKSEWKNVLESADYWLMCDRSFLRLIDWPHLNEVSEMEGVEVNGEAHDATPWRWRD